jgi:uncharacterized protein
MRQSPAIKPRRPDFRLREVPRYWAGGDPVGTHLSNALFMLFPAGERFFIRSVRRFESRYRDDPARMKAIRGFYGQEGAHAAAHDDAIRILEEQGYEVRPFLDRFEKFCFGFAEKHLPAELSLSATAATEHFTALMARNAFDDPVFANEAHPEMRNFMLWHAAEEIEHKSVAFDVLQDVNPSWVLRAAGMVIAASALVYFWREGTKTLLRQEGITGKEALARIKAIRDESGRDFNRDVLVKGVLEYLKPGFHPWQVDDLHKAEAFLATLEGGPEPVTA